MGGETDGMPGGAEGWYTPAIQHMIKMEMQEVLHVWAIHDRAMTREDMQQEACLRLCLAASRYDASKARWHTFAQRHIWGALRDCLRSSRNPVRQAAAQQLYLDTQKAASRPDPFGNLLRCEQRKDLLQLIGCLTPAQQALCKCIAEGSQQADIARLYGVTESAITYRLKTIRRRLARRCQKEAP